MLPPGTGSSSVKCPFDSASQWKASVFCSFRRYSIQRYVVPSDVVSFWMAPRTTYGWPFRTPSVPGGIDGLNGTAVSFLMIPNLSGGLVSSFPPRIDPQCEHAMRTVFAGSLS